MVFVAFVFSGVCSGSLWVLGGFSSQLKYALGSDSSLYILFWGAPKQAISRVVLFGTGDPQKMVFPFVPFKATKGGVRH